MLATGCFVAFGFSQWTARSYFFPIELTIRLRPEFLAS
jgi:hypothetical protein